MIRFTQYIRPRGNREFVDIDRGAEMNANAEKLLASGWGLSCEVLRDGTVAFYAEKGMESDDPIQLIELSPNGPTVRDAVDKLILNALRVEKL